MVKKICREMGKWKEITRKREGSLHTTNTKLRPGSEFKHFEDNVKSSGDLPYKEYES